MTAAAKTNNPLIKQGLAILKKNLGSERALRFVMSIERNKGDSVEALRRQWAGKKAIDIHHEIIQARKKKLI